MADSQTIIEYFKVLETTSDPMLLKIVVAEGMIMDWLKEHGQSELADAWIKAVGDARNA